MSQLFRPGPEKNLRREVPNVPNVSGENSDVSKYDWPERGSLILNEPGVKFGVSTEARLLPRHWYPAMSCRQFQPELQADRLKIW